MKRTVFMLSVTALLTGLVAQAGETIKIGPDGWGYVDASRLPKKDPPLVLDAKLLQAASPTLRANWTIKYYAQATFTLAEAPKAAALMLKPNWPDRTTGEIWLNGKKVSGEFEGMRYSTIPTLDPALLKAGENLIQVMAQVPSDREGQQPPLEMVITAATAEDLAFDVQPILGVAGDDFFTVTARTTIPAIVTLTYEHAGKKVTVKSDKPGVVHGFRVAKLAPGQYSYKLTANVDDDHKVESLPGKFVVGPVGDKWRFVALGDSRTFPERWGQVMQAVAKNKGVRMVLHSGDIVANGRIYDSWSREFSTPPAAKALVNLPLYPVLGNHEENASIFEKLFALPEGDRVYWSQRRGDVLFIGIDGSRGWAVGSENVKRLDKQLAASKAKYIFLVTHYPAASSSSHGKVDENGDYTERSMRESSNVIAPLLAKYNATVIIAGHDHCYERSEVNGVTCITSGGAGAPTYGQAPDAEKRNPYSKVFYAGLHYLLFDVGPKQVKMRVLTPEGKKLDERVWPARKVKPSATAKPAAVGK